MHYNWTFKIVHLKGSIKDLNKPKNEFRWRILDQKFWIIFRITNSKMPVLMVTLCGTLNLVTPPELYFTYHIISSTSWMHLWWCDRHWFVDLTASTERGVMRRFSSWCSTRSSSSPRWLMGELCLLSVDPHIYRVVINGNRRKKLAGLRAKRLWKNLASLRKKLAVWEKSWYRVFRQNPQGVGFFFYTSSKI